VHNPRINKQISGKGHDENWSLMERWDRVGGLKTTLKRVVSICFAGEVASCRSIENNSEEGDANTSLPERWHHDEQW